MRVRFSITAKLLVVFSSITIIAVAIVGSYSFYAAKKAIINRTLDQLVSVRSIKKEQIEYFFAEKIKNAEALVQYAYPEKLINQLRYGATADQMKENLSMARGYYKKYGFSNLYLVYENYGGKTQFLELDTLPIHAIQSKKIIWDFWDVVCKSPSDAHLSDLILRDQKDTLPVCLIGIGIPALQNIHGGIVLQISSSQINKIILQGNSEFGLGNTGESYLVGPDLIMRSSSRFIPNAILRTTASTSSTSLALQKQSGTLESIDYRGVRVISAYDFLSIRELNWVLIVDIDYAETMIPIRSIRNDILFFSVILLILMLVVVQIFTKMISGPIIKLEKAAIRVGKGNYDIAVDVRSRDEIGSLAASFRQMVFQLKERETRLNHIYNATKEGVVFHANGRILLSNKAMEEISGYKLSELIDIRLSQIIDHHIVLHDEKGSIKCTDLLETMATRKDGSKIHVEIQQSIIIFEEMEIAAMVMRNIDIRKTAEKELQLERRKRFSALLDGQEMERLRVSQDLHDGLGQRLVAAKFQLENFSSTDPEKSKVLLGEMKEGFSSLIEDVRQICNDLMPAALNEFGLENALKMLCNEIHRKTGIETEFSCDGLKGDLGKKTNIYLYRIAQEAMNNSLKHAKATKINIQMIESKDFIVLIAEDNGIGFTFEKNSFLKGNGLYNMRERVVLLGGKVDLESAPGKGTTIRVQIPKSQVI